MELVIDYRETSLCESLTKIGVQFKQENLLLGDILFRLDSKAIAIIERKTLADYAASHLTNRYREQRARLQTARTEGTYIAYLLEGGWQYSPYERVWGPPDGRNVTEKMLRILAYRDMRLAASLATAVAWSPRRLERRRWSAATTPPRK